MIVATELGMLARLKAVADTGVTGFAWRTLTTYPDDWDAYLGADVEIRCPAAWVVFAGWTAAERTEAGDLHVTASFGLMIADENLRPAEQYQRHGGPNIAKEPGSYRLAIAAVTSLSGQSLGLPMVQPLEVGQLRPVRPSEAMRKRKFSMYAAEFTCVLPLALVGDGAIDPADLETLHVNWDIPPFDSPDAIDADPAPGRQLPDDAHADATDIISLGEPQT
jgi:phage gp37-like protein